MNIEQQVISILNTEIGIDWIAPETEIGDLELSDWDWKSILGVLEEAFEIFIPEEKVKEFTIIKNLIDFIGEEIVE